MISRRDPERQVAGGAGHRATLEGELRAVHFVISRFRGYPNSGDTDLKNVSPSAYRT